MNELQRRHQADRQVGLLSAPSSNDIGGVTAHLFDLSRPQGAGSEEMATTTQEHLLTIIGEDGKPVGLCSCAAFTKRAETTDEIHTAWVAHRPDPEPTLFEVGAR